MVLILLLIVFFFSFIKFSFADDIFSHGSRDKNMIALTFDDGPSLETLNILQVLAAENVTATFFMIGRDIERYPEITQQVIDSGNEVGIHSYTHKYSLIFFESGELNKTKNLLREHNLTTNLFRPPWGRDSLILHAKTRELGDKTILYDLPANDYKKGLNSSAAAKRILGLVRNGSILDFHDTQEITPELLREILPELKKEYKLVNVSTILGITNSEV